MPEDPASPACRNFLNPIVNPENANVDLVAVHGLNPLNQECHAEQTWTENDKLWLRDFLPAQLPKARVLLYGYNANVAFQTSTSGVRQQADNSLNWLHLMRKENSDRPIVFICHSLGGLVVKQALVNATNNPEYGSIRRTTHGIAFFATPHRGVNGADLGGIAATIARGVLLNPKSSFLDALKKDSIFAEMLRDDETLYTKKIGLVVDKASATLGLGGKRETMVDLEADHSGVCKFGSDKSPMYQRVSLNLVSLVEEATNLALKRQESSAKSASTTTVGAMTAVGSPKARFFAVPYTENPNFVGRTEILGRLRDTLEPDPGKASSHAQARAALYGLGGVGKTQIAISYAYWLQEHYPQISVFWVHASSRQRFRESYEAICRECAVPEADKPGSDHLQILHQWLKTKSHGDWLMIIDNADDTEVFFNAAESTATDEMLLEGGRQELRLAKFIPECSHGAILVTTRNKQAGVKLTKGRALLEVDKMTPKEAEDLVTSRLPDTILDPQELSTLVKSLEHLPLALIQATAFIQQESTSLSDYLKMIEDNDLLLKLLEEPFEDFGRDEEIPNPVSTTWKLSFDLIRRVNPRASELLSIMAFFDWNAIPKDLLKQTGDNEVDLQKAWGLLEAFSLITQTADSSAFNVHRLIHLVVRRWLFVELEEERWAAKALAILSEAFPSDQIESWRICADYLPHAAALLDQDLIPSSEQTALLLFKVSDYLAQRGKFGASERFKVEALAIRIQVHPPGHITTMRCMYDLTWFWNKYGLHDKAVALAQSTREIVERMRGPTHCDTLISMTLQAHIYRGQRDFEKATTLESQVLEIRKRVLGCEHPLTLLCQQNLAVVYLEQKLYKEAMEANLQVMEIRQRVLGPEHPHTVDSLEYLAVIFRDQRLYDKALAVCDQVREIRQRILGPEHLQTVMGMQYLAMILWDQKLYEKAATLLSQVLEVHQRTLGPEHQSTLITMQSLAVIFRDQKLYGKAAILISQVLETQKQIHGTEYPDTHDSMELLAMISIEQGLYEQAVTLLSQALEFQKRELGTEHSRTLGSMKLLAKFFKDQKLYAKARTLLSQVLETEKRLLGPEHPDTLMSLGILATFHSEQGHYEEAMTLLSQVLETEKRLLGPEHPDTLMSLGILATFYSEQGHYEEATALRLQIMKTRQRVFGATHPDTLTSMNSLATTYCAQERYKEASVLFSEVLEVQKRVLGPEHPDTLTSMSSLVATYFAQQLYEEAATLVLRILEIQKRVFGPEHPDTLAYMSDLARIHGRQNLFAKAAALYSQVLEARKRVLGLEHPDTLGSMLSLGNTYFCQESYEETADLLSKVLEVQKRVLVPEHPDTLATINTLAFILELPKLGREAGARNPLVKELESSVLNNSPPHTLDASPSASSSRPKAQSKLNRRLRFFSQRRGRNQPQTAMPPAKYPHQANPHAEASNLLESTP